MSDQNVTKSAETTAKKSEEMVTLRPLVSIVEADNGFTLTAEMPGVPKEGVEVNVENDTLTLTGSIKIDTPEGMEATYAEVQNARYQRAFTLSRRAGYQQNCSITSQWCADPAYSESGTCTAA